MPTIARRYYVNLNNMEVTESLGSRSPVTKISAKARDNANWGFQFHRDGAPELLEAATTLTFGIKEQNDFAGSLLASISSFTAATTTNDTGQTATDYYYGVLNLNTTEVTTAISTDPKLAAMCELQLDLGGGGARQSTPTITFDIFNDVVQGGEGTPSDAGDPTAYLLAEDGIRYYSELSSLTGGTSADLDSLTTAGGAIAAGTLIAIVDGDSSDVVRHYELVAGTDAESAPDVIRPDDYATTTNEFVWKLRSDAFAALNADGSVAGTGMQELLGLNLTDPTTLTISSGAVTATQGFHIIAAESGTTDDLATITAAKGTGDRLILKADAGDTITLTETGGNIELYDGTDVAITGDQVIELIYDGSNWNQIGRVGGASSDGQYQTISLPLNSFGITSGSPAWSTDNTEAATGLSGWLFDGTTDEYIEWLFHAPEDMDFSTAPKLKLTWTASAAGLGNVVWRAALNWIASGESPTAGSYVSTTDTLSSDLRVETTSAIALASTGSLGEQMYLIVTRDANSGSDTLSGDCKLLGAALQYKIDVDASTAW